MKWQKLMETKRYLSGLNTRCHKASRDNSCSCSKDVSHNFLPKIRGSRHVTRTCPLIKAISHGGIGLLATCRENCGARCLTRCQSFKGGWDVFEIKSLIDIHRNMTLSNHSQHIR